MESIHKEDRRLVLEIIAKRRSGELHGRTELEYRIRTASGETRWLRSVITSTFDEAAQADCFVELAEDVTERKQAELKLEAEQRELGELEMRAEELSQTVMRLQQEIEQRKQIEADLRRSETRFRRLVEANIIGVVFSDIYGSVFDANEAFLRMTGCPFGSPTALGRHDPREWSRRV